MRFLQPTAALPPKHSSDASHRVRAPLSTLIIARMTFGSAGGYTDNGGIAIFDDFDPGRDLTRETDSEVALAAVVAGNCPTQVRLELKANPDLSGFVFVRAQVRGETVVPRAAVEIRDGRAVADLLVLLNLPPSAGTVDADWVWEIESEPGRFEPLVTPRGDSVWPTRIYLTAAPPCRDGLVESFFHVACSIDCPATPDAVERAVWSVFAKGLHGKPLTNARGRALSFWRDIAPGVGKADYIGRLAIDLVRHGDASCRAWADLLSLCFAVHGIRSDVKAVQPKLTTVLPKLGLPSFLVPDGRGGKRVERTIGLMVRPFRWETDAAAPSAENAGQVVNAFKFRWKLNNVADADAVDWSTPDVTDAGRPAQGNPAAPGLFGNHALVRVVRDGVTRWYDPSFGIGPHSTIADYEDQLLGRGTENPGGIFAIIGWQKSSDGATSEGLLLGAHPMLPGTVLEVVDVG